MVTIIKFMVLFLTKHVILLVTESLTCKYANELDRELSKFYRISNFHRKVISIIVGNLRTDKSLLRLIWKIKFATDFLRISFSIIINESSTISSKLNTRKRYTLLSICVTKVR